MTPWLLVTGDFVKTGGMDRANYALARYLALRGSETHLVAHRVDDDLVQFPNVFFHRVPKPLDSYLAAAPLLDRIGRFWAAKVAARSGRVVVNGGGCLWGDVNWVHYVHAAYRRQSAAGLMRHFKSSLAYARARVTEPRALSIARLIIANSMRTASEVVALLGAAPAMVHTVYLGVDAERFRPAAPDERKAMRKILGLDKSRPALVFVGALGDDRKGFDRVFEAYKVLCRGPGWDADMVVVGAGAELSAWKKRAVAEGLASRISFLGFRGDIPGILHACDILVSPNRYESYGLNVHEALCCGLPAIVSADAGVAERYPSYLRDLLLLPDPEDVDQLAEHLLAWRANPDYWRERVLSFSRELRSYTWDDMARDIVALAEPSIESGDCC